METIHQEDLKNPQFGHNSALTILIVDDDEGVRDSLTQYLCSSGWNTVSAQSGSEAIELVKSGQGDIVISDVRMPGMSGIDLTRKLKTIDSNIEVLIATGHSSEGLAIEALKAGAFDYFRKPLDVVEVSTSLERTKRFREMKLENSRLKAVIERIATINDDHAFIGESLAAKMMLRKIEKVAHSPITTVLLTGESGVGKEIVARLVHKLSRSPSSPFIAVNCGGIAETLLEAELFGKEKGAYTGADKTTPGIFEMANNGTVLLDEISEMSFQAQSRFLRVLEERKVRRVGGTKEICIGNTRIIAATNKNLQERVEKNKFREDLYFRIMVAPIHIPPLHERPDDILPLAYHFLNRFTKSLEKEFRFEKITEQVLLAYNFPGNARELRNIVERAAIFASASAIQPKDLGIDLSSIDFEDLPELKTSDVEFEVSSLNLAEIEEEAIRKATSDYPGNHSAAARQLGITPQSLYRKMDKYGIKQPTSS